MERFEKINGVCVFAAVCVVGLAFGAVVLTTIGDFLRWREKNEDEELIGREMAFGEAPSTFFSSSEKSEPPLRSLPGDGGHPYFRLVDARRR